MHKRGRGGVLLACAAGLFCGNAFADSDASFDALLKQHNLSKMGFYLVLPDEAAVHNDVRALRTAKNQIGKDARAQENADRAVKRCQAELDSEQSEFVGANNNLAQLSASLKSISKDEVQRYNDRVNAINAAHARVNAMAVALDRKSKELDDLKAKAATTADARAKYVNTTMDVGGRAEGVVKAYEALAGDAALTAALDQFNKSQPKPIRLGPSGVFQDDLKFIRDCEKDVVTGPISVTRDGGVSRVDAMLNESVSDKMIWDSGAALVTLSSATADALNLHPGDTAPSVTLTVADGRTVSAKIATLKSLRVGGFLVKDVECAILPPDVKGSDDLLGNTFQKHFTSRLDQQTGQLLLTPHDASVLVGPVAKPVEVAAGKPAEAPVQTPPPQPTPPPPDAPTTAPADRPRPDPVVPVPGNNLVYTEVLANLQGNTDHTDDGAIVLKDGEFVITPQKYKPPVHFRITAQTDSHDIRIGYAARSIVFNWKANPNLLHFEGGPLDGTDADGAGKIPAKKWVRFDILILPHFIQISTDGRMRFQTRQDFSTTDQPLQISTDQGTTIKVKSVMVSTFARKSPGGQ